MAYFVVERSRDDGTLSIPLPDAYETRDAAIAALSAATASGAISLLGEVFIADLGAAVPVLVMPSVPSAVTPAEPTPIAASEPLAAEDAEVMADAAESGEPVAEGDVEPGELDEAASDEAFSSWEPLGEISAAESTLADALKRAATSLEEEGIVAPDSIVSGVEAEADQAVAVTEAAEEAEASAADEVPVAEGAQGDTAAWPWANVESYEIKVDSAELLASDEDAVEGESGEPLIESEELAEGEAVAEDEIEPDETAAETEIVAEEQAIITSAPAEGEEAYMPKPVILGDYLDSLSAVVDEEPEEPEEPAVSGDSGETAEPEASDAEELDLSGPEEPEELEESEAALVAELAKLEVGEPESAEVVPVDEPVSEGAASVPEVGYEATGELKLEDYSCPDCVYSNTCPKVGQTTPAECGSFQWRSE